MIQFNQVSKTYTDGHEALSGISFSLDKGEIAFLTGHSGAGKSTLLKLIALLERPSFGEILVHSQRINNFKKRQVPKLRQQIGLIFQNPHLLPERNIFENVALPLIIAGYRYREIAPRVHAALDKVGLLYKEYALPESLSCGEQQRLGIARAIVNRPSILLADEPTGNLDPDLSRDIMKLFEAFNNVGVTVLIASHDLALIQKMQHRTLTLHEGRLLHDGVTS